MREYAKSDVQVHCDQYVYPAMNSGPLSLLHTVETKQQHAERPRALSDAPVNTEVKKPNSYSKVASESSSKHLLFQPTPSHFQT